MYFLNGYWYFVHFIRLQRLNGDSTGACLLQKCNCSHGLKLGTCMGEMGSLLSFLPFYSILDDC